MINFISSNVNYDLTIEMRPVDRNFLRVCQLLERSQLDKQNIAS